MARILDDWITGFLDLTDNSEPPKAYREWVAVSVIASLMQRKCFLPWGTLTFYPNMYIVLVGPSGKCRKGTAMGFGSLFLDSAGIKMAAEATTRESLIRQLSKASGTHIDPQTGNIHNHASLTIYSQELTVFLGYDNKQLIADLTDWYDCRNHWKYETKNMGTDDIFGVWVNLIGATTPELIQSALPRDAIGGGLASRMIFIYEPDKAKTVYFPELPKGGSTLLNNLKEDLEAIGMLSGPFRYDDTMKDIYYKWRKKHEKDPPFQGDKSFVGYIQRRPNHLFKLSMILSASCRDDRLITGEIYQRAIDMLEEAEVKMPRAFTGYGSARKNDVLIDIMNHISTVGSITKKKLFITHHADLEYGMKSLDQILDDLHYMDFAKRIMKGDELTIVFNPKSIKGKAFQ